MKKKPILSIIIPVYNGQNYLNDCLKSIVSNDLNDVEILIINDGSTDSSLKIIKKYSNKYSQIVYYDRKNSGVSATRNFGLKKSRGKSIWFIDRDDLIKPKILKNLIKLLIDTNLDIFLFRYTEFNKKVNDFSRENELTETQISQYDAMKTLIDSKYATFPWNKIFKKSLFSNIYFPTTRDFTEDMAIIYKLYDKASSFFITTSSLYFYRQRKDSLVHTISLKNLRASAISHYEMVSFFEKKYSKLAPKLQYETIVSIISYFHRINLWKIKKDNDLYSYLLKYRNYSVLNNRYKVEILSLKYCYPIFKIIGYMGVLHRKLKNEK